MCFVAQDAVHRTHKQAISNFLFCLPFIIVYPLLCSIKVTLIYIIITVAHKKSNLLVQLLLRQLKTTLSISMDNVVLGGMSELSGNLSLLVTMQISA